MTIATTSADLDAMNTELHKQVRYPIYGVFTTTGTTAVVKCPSNVRRFRIAGAPFPTSQPATDENLYLDGSVHTVNTDGTFNGVADGKGGYTIQIARNGASKTSGLGFMFEIIGLP